MKSTQKAHCVPVMIIPCNESSLFLQVGAKHDAVMCFGPAVPDGFGCCYNPQNSRLNFAVTSFYECSDTDSDVFVNTLRSTLLDMQKLLAGKSQAKL